MADQQAQPNAEMETWRRGMEDMQERRRQEVESNLGRAQPWVRRLWEEDQAERRWGFAAFFDVGVDDDHIEEFESRLSNMLWCAKDAVGCHGPIGEKWRLQYLDWPEVEVEEESEEEEGEPKSSEDQGSKEETSDATMTGDEMHVDDIDEFEPDLPLLRERFRCLCDRLSGGKDDTGTGVGPDRLEDGLLTNVFLLITQPCIDSVLEGYVDNAWIWAIDPDCELSSSTPNQSGKGFPGYLRVRVQQLVNNFFEARRFRAHDVSMEQLWKAAQKSKNQAFVSLRDDEVGLWKMNRDVGSAMRLKGTERIVTSLDDHCLWALTNR